MKTYPFGQWTSIGSLRESRNETRTKTFDPAPAAVLEIRQQ
jgi:hypothetical protein